MIATDLVRYVASEIAADGPEGSSVDRLSKFIDEYASQQASRSSEEASVLDEDLRRYVIETLGRLPNISPGRCVAASRSTKADAKRKGKGKQNASSDDDDDDEGAPASTPRSKINSASLEANADHVEVQESDKGKSLQELLSIYGASLRLVADKESINAICGRVVLGMSTAVYQLILYVMRKRGIGASFPEIGKKFDYTTSSVFFLVKQLCDADLAIKFRAKDGSGPVSWIVAKQYAHLCPHINQETLLDGQDETAGGVDDDGNQQTGVEGEENENQIADATLQEMSDEAVQDLIRRGQGKPAQDDDDDNEDGADDQAEEEVSTTASTNEQERATMVTLHGLLAYPAVDLQKQEVLLRDRSLVRMRLLKLLFASKNHATIRADLIVRIGVKEPVPAMRKAFNAILRQMEAEDLIKRCLLRRPLEHDRDHKDHCWMATEAGRDYLDQMSTSLQHRQIKRLKVELGQEIEKSKSKIFLEPSFNKQMLDLIEESQDAGMTIERLNMILGGNRARKRDLDHMLTALKKPGNPYYEDLTLYSALEQEGRTRSQRFYTRQWRPSHLAPNEARRVDPRKLNAWVKLPYEQDASTRIQPKSKGKMKSSQTITEGDDDEDDQIGSESSIEASPRVRKKVKSKATASEEPKTIGRPRKHHTERALKVAQQYKERKEARIKEEEERRGVEDLLGEPSVPVRKTRKRRSIPAQVDTIADANDEMTIAAEQGQSVPSREEAATQTDSMANSLPVSSFTPITPPSLPTPKTPILKRASSQSTSKTSSGGTKRSRIRSGDAKKSSINLTLQLKIDALRDFFKKTVIFESTTFEYHYAKFLRESLGDHVSTQPYEMDRKLRLKLLHQFEREGMICCKKVPAPIFSKDKLRTVWHIKEISEESLTTYCRDVSNGDVRRDGSRRGRDGKWKKTVANEPVLLETHQMDGVDEFLMRLGSGAEFEANNLDDFLGNQKIREIFMDHEKVRSQYTGRFSGQGAQIRYLYSTVLQLLNEGKAAQYRLADKTFDLSWWIMDARLEQYLKLVTPPKDDLITDASQNVRLMMLPVKKIPGDIQAALRISEGKEGLLEALQPLMDVLVSFHLAEAVVVNEEGQAIMDAAGRDNLTYRFNTRGSIMREQLHFEEIDTSVTYDLTDMVEAEKYWQLMEEIFTLQDYDSVRRDMTLEQAELYKDLLTKTAWSPNYFMMKPQKMFLRKTMSLGVGAEVVDNEILLEKISKVCLSPKAIVRRWYERRYKVRSSSTPMKPRSGPDRSGGSKRNGVAQGDKKAKASASTQDRPLSIRKLNAIKRREARERKKRYEEFGSVILASLVEMGFDESDCATTLARLAHVRRQYSSSDVILTAKRVRSIFREVMRGYEAGDATWKDIENRRRRPMQPAPVVKEVAVKVQDKEGPRSRKSAFSWTRDRDELLRDAVVILRCRDRFRSKNPNNIRRNWAALDQIFPDIGAQSRFSRFDLLEKAVGEEAYLHHLEIEWDKVWAENRGDDLEDEYPADPVNFDLMHHVKFLRSHIDKVKVARDVDNATADPLPLDNALLLQYFDYDRPLLSYDNPASTLARSLLADPSTEIRSRALRSSAFTSGAASDGYAPYTADQQSTLLDLERSKGLIMGTIKMILNTAESDYSEPKATALCRDNASGDIIEEALSEMMDLRIIKRKTKEDREVPNRNMIFTEEYERFHLDPLETIPFWELTEQIDSLIKKSDETRLYQTTEDQETAASLILLSADRVDAAVDFTPVERFKSDIFFNAKKLNDANLEVPIDIQIRSRRQHIQKKWIDVIEEKEPQSKSIVAWSGNNSKSVKDRVTKAWTHWIDQLKEGEEQMTARKIRERLELAGPIGVSRSDLKSNGALLQTLQDDKLPLIFTAGYSEGRIVSAEYIEQWTVRLHSDHRIYPNKWYDINGNFIGSIWSQCVKLVIHAIMTRPGITLAQLMIQFKLVMDRMELCEVIDHACSLQVIYKVLCSNDLIKGTQAEWQADNDDELALMAYSITD